MMGGLQKNAVGCSQHTPDKQGDFAAILGVHIRICKAILPRWRGLRRYVAYDLNAGPGYYEHGGYLISGSPVIFRNVLRSSGLAFDLHMIEGGTENAEALRRNWCDDCAMCQGECSFYCGDHSDLLPRILPVDGKDRLGFIYHDPNGIPTAIDALAAANKNKATRTLDHVLNLSATAIKRVRRERERRTGSPGERLTEMLSRIGKQKWVVREPRGDAQWTMIIGTNWRKPMTWESRGFYDIDSLHGRSILRRLDCTRGELEEAA